jgi:gliding motility-associated-like protein
MTVINDNACNFQWKFGGTVIKSGTVSAGGLNLTNVGAGTYTFDVICAGAVSTTCTATIGQPTAIVIPTTGVVTSEACGQKGSINISATSGGNGGFTYNWNPALGNTPNPTNLSAGTYSVTVTDAKSCTATATFPVGNTQTPLSTVTITGTNVKCKDGSDGSALVNVSGGCTPYTYTWTGGLSGPNPQNIKAGSYTVTVSDSATPAKTGTATVTITEPTAAVSITLNGTTDASTSTASDGKINITVEGGTKNYKTVWSGGIPDANTSGILEVNNVKAGTYSVTVTDANGCSAVRNGIVVNIRPEMEIAPELGDISVSSSFNGFGIKCFGENNGVITGKIAKGTYPITITLKSGNQTVGTPIVLSSGTDFNFSNLVAGTYTVMASNATLPAVTSTPIVITQPSKLAATSSINCSNKNEETGSIELNLNNTGAGNYSFSWLDQTDMDNKLESIPVGFYNVTITDANKCELKLTNLEVKACSQQGTCYTASTVITPNVDNFNDVFIINCVEDNPGDLTIFDRWGREVYFQSNYDNTWQGADVNNETLKEGAYIWVLNVNFGQGRREVYKGTVTLLR